MPETNDLDRREFLLVAALCHASVPVDDHAVASCHRVLKQAMSAAGEWEDAMAEAFHGHDEAYARFPSVLTWYRSLIALTRVEPDSERLLEGAGNLDLPAGAHFTGCWLTDEGRRAALKLIEGNPRRFSPLEPAGDIHDV